MSQPEPSTNKWTQDEESKVICLVNDGYSITEIARLINRTRNSVKQKVSSLGLDAVKKFRSGNEKYTEDQIIEASKLWNEGKLSSSEISNQIGILDSSFRKIRQQRQELFAKREPATLIKLERKAKPSPENTVIQYEFTEIEAPSGALYKPFFCTEVGECAWILQDFWSETRFDSPCCGLPVVDQRGKGLKKSLCQYHYDASVEKR